MMNKAISFLIVVCWLLANCNQFAFSQQQNTEPLYYHGLTGHFDQNQTYANAGLIVDEVAAGSPFKKMQSLEKHGPARALRKGDRISGFGGGSISTVREFNEQIDDAKHRHGRMYVSINSSDLDSDGEMFLVQAQPVRKNGFRLGIIGAAGPNGGTAVVEVPAGSPATKLWSPTQTERTIYLEKGDEIMSVNGIATLNSAAVVQALSKSENGVATLKVRNVNDGAIYTFFAEPSRTATSPKIHYVIAGQSATSKFNPTADAKNFDRGIKLDLIHLDMLTRHVRHEFVGSAILLQGDRCTAAEIKKAVAAIDSNRDDTIFVYFSGHGAYDQNGHFLALGGPRLYRKEIQKILKRKSVRLSVFVSDACNGDATPPKNLGRPASSGGFTTNGLTKIESLLLNYRGTIDLNAADKDQLGWSNTLVGGYFTYQFTKYLTSQKNDTRDWKKALNAIAENSNSFYKKTRADEITRGTARAAMKQQLEMTPEFFQFAIQPAPAGIRVGPRTFEGVKPVEMTR